MRGPAREVISCPVQRPSTVPTSHDVGAGQLAAVASWAVTPGAPRHCFQLRQWFTWCDTKGLDPLTGCNEHSVELYIRQLGEHGGGASVVTMTCAPCAGTSRFAHTNRAHSRRPCCLRAAAQDPSGRVPAPEACDSLELIPHQVAQTITVHHGTLARASEAAAVQNRGLHRALRGYRVLHLMSKGNKPATMQLTVPASYASWRPAAVGPKVR